MGRYLNAKFPGLRAKSPKEKHVEALVAEWFRLKPDLGTMANRMSVARW